MDKTKGFPQEVLSKEVTFGGFPIRFVPIPSTFGSPGNVWAKTHFGESAVDFVHLMPASCACWPIDAGERDRRRDIEQNVVSALARCAGVLVCWCAQPASGNETAWAVTTPFMGFDLKCKYLKCIVRIRANR